MTGGAADTLRLLHMTDVHFFRPRGLEGAFGKRALGLANLYIKGRRHYFDPDRVVPVAVDDALRHTPDLFCHTGDVTALSAPEEFVAARAAFAPLLDSVPSVVVPGNHDVYTRGAERSARMEETFAPFMAGGTWDDEAGRWVGAPPLGGGPVPWPSRFRLGFVDVIATNPCRPGLLASGRFGPGAIARAEELVRESRAAGQVVVYLTHYPVLEPEGAIYDHAGHALLDVHELVESLRRAPPDLLLHGHEHQAFRQTLEGEGRNTLVLGCGTTSAVTPLRPRAAGYFLVELGRDGVRAVRRRVRDPETGAFLDDPDLSDA